MCKRAVNQLFVSYQFFRHMSNYSSFSNKYSKKGSGLARGMWCPFDYILKPRLNKKWWCGA